MPENFHQLFSVICAFLPFCSLSLLPLFPFSLYSLFLFYFSFYKIGFNTYMQTIYALCGQWNIL